MRKENKELWSNRIVFLLALIGSAVGLGNIWRFPYIAREEGLYFILFYILFSFSIGVIGIYLEIFAGSTSRLSLLSLAKKYIRKYYFFVALSFLTVVIIGGYYTVVSSWTLAFTLFPNLDFPSFKNSIYPLIFTLLINLSSLLVVKLGVHKGIEVVNKYFVSLLFLLVVILFLYTFSWERLFLSFSSLPKKLSIDVVISALSQSFFSLSLGSGLLYTYALFARPRKLLKSSIITSVSDTLIAFLSFITISSILFMFSVSITSPEELTFVVMNELFSNLEFGFVFSTLFFLLLFLASYTSIVSFYSFLEFNLPKRYYYVIYIPIFLSSLVALDWVFNLDLIYFLDRYVVELLLPISMLVNFILFVKYYLSKGKEQSLSSLKLPTKNNL